MDTSAYLKRIRYNGQLEPTLHTLQALHEAHMYTVPFENLDIPRGRPIRLDITALFRKIVLQRRGGFCYELNGLFADLLHELGFEVTLLSAGMAHAAGEFGPELDHLTLLVHLAEDWLVDVGNGASFCRPLRVQEALEHVEGVHVYRLERAAAYWIVQTRIGDGIWKPVYRFTMQPHMLTDFIDRCHYYQTSPASHFTHGRMCSLATPEGRITLRDQQLITTIHNEKHEYILADQQEYEQVLAQQFDVVLV